MVSIKKTSRPTAGSNAGRGFRYQDILGALFVAKVWLGEIDRIVPEGSDDFEIYTAHGLVLVDAKSSRPGVRARSVVNTTAVFEALWSRSLKDDTEVSEYWLVSEAPPVGVASVGKTNVTFPNAPTNPKAKISFVMVEPEPHAAAIDLLVRGKSLSPLAADLTILAFAKAVGDLASANGPLALEDRSPIAATDAERIAHRVLSAVDADRLERLMRSGFVEPVDFVSAIEEPGFYLGVDVQPGHFVAGLALDRPTAVAGVLDALARTRAVVLVGPSGAGKSGLMWNSVITLRNDRRWFRIRGLGPPDEEALTAFLHAYADAGPIGFVVDDIGRGRVEIWRRLHDFCTSHSEALLIGSTRTEDAVLLPSRHSILELTVGPDPQLAKKLWQRLRENNQTPWSGWAEPWSQSEGLLLEYGHILTKGERLDAVIIEQLRTRLHEHRDDELAILAASAPVAIHGGAVAIKTLRDELGLSVTDMVRALDRLLSEHLVRVDGAGALLTGLHAVRATSICGALMRLGYSDASTQARMALRVAAMESIESVAHGVISAGAISVDEAGGELATRLASSHCINDLTRSLRGVRAGGLTLVARTWLAEVRAKGCAPKLATTLAMLGLLPEYEVPEIGEMSSMSALGRKLIRAVSAQKPPPSLVDQIVVRIGSTDSTMDAASVTDSLAALTGAPLEETQIAQLSAACPAFDTWPITNVIMSLDAAYSVHGDIAATWVHSHKTEQTDLDVLARVIEETPFALIISREQGAEGLILHGDIYEAAIGPEENPNDLLVAHCHAMLMAEPKARIAHVRLVDASGRKTFHLDSEKRIPRENSPPHALAQWNSRAIDAVAQEVGAESWSTYLTQGQELLSSGHKAFRKLLDSVMVNRVNEQALDALNEVVHATDRLIAPFKPAPKTMGVDPSSAVSGKHLTPLQNIVFSLNAQLIVNIAKLPSQAALLAMRARDLIDLVDKSRTEPWQLIGDTPPAILDEVEVTLHDIELIALEAAASEVSPRQRWSKANGKPKDAFDFVTRRSRVAFEKRIAERRKTVEVIIAATLPGAKVIAPEIKDGVIWYTRFIASFPIVSLEGLRRWVVDASTLGDRIKSQLAAGEDVCLVPLLNGQVAVDYAYQLSRSSFSDSRVAEVLATAGRTSLLGPPDASLVQRIGAPVLAQPETINVIFLALRDISGMLQFGFGTTGRPIQEIQRLEQAVAHLHEHGQTFLALLDGMDYPFIGAIRHLTDMLTDTNDSVMDLDQSLPLEGLQDALIQLAWRTVQETVPAP